MGVDNSKALLRITFDGLFIICRNNVQRWEVGVPNLGDHTFGVELVQITGNLGPTEEPHDIKLDRDISITPTPDLAPELFDPAGFDRLSDGGDPEDYRWLLDMEGREFHAGKRMQLRAGGRGYKARIFIEGGKLYTAAKTIERYRRVKVSNPQDDIELGKLAITAGINLDRADAGSRTILIKNVGGSSQPKTLSQQPGVRYELSFTHAPAAGTIPARETHFDHYYQTLKADDTDTRYDVESVTPFGPTDAPDLGVTHRHEDKSTSGHEEATSSAVSAGNRFGTEPQVCNSVYLGSFRGLPR
jgi:hypothetical protein